MPQSFRLRLGRFFNLIVLILFAAISADAGILIVAYSGEARTALFDADTYKIIATLPTGTGPHEIRVSPDRRFAYVAISGTGPSGVKGNSITVIDIKNRKVKANFDLGDYTSPHDVRVSRDGRLIWVACAPARTILELDSASGKILKTYKTDQDGSWFLEITPDERKIYAPNLEGKSVSVIDRATGAVKVIPFEAPVYGIDITPDGRQIWVSGPGLAVIDTATDEVIARIKTTETATGRIRLAPDGKKVVVGMSKKVLVYDVETRQLTGEIDIGAQPKVITVSADSRRAFLTNPGNNSVTVVDLVAGKQVATFQTGKAPDGIAWVD
ncbi:MAG: beta-propeller fold lactonase family protein [Blastocatellia bacterium]|nr:beta-propeller fold lactonase family protein [Blastocatellia bacterium]